MAYFSAFSTVCFCPLPDLILDFSTDYPWSFPGAYSRISPRTVTNLFWPISRITLRTVPDLFVTYISDFSTGLSPPSRTLVSGISPWTIPGLSLTYSLDLSVKFLLKSFSRSLLSISVAATVAYCGRCPAGVPRASSAAWLEVRKNTAVYPQNCIHNKWHWRGNCTQR